jgi:hypothetical protein
MFKAAQRSTFNRLFSFKSAGWPTLTFELHPKKPMAFYSTPTGSANGGSWPSGGLLSINMAVLCRSPSAMLVWLEAH